MYHLCSYQSTRYYLTYQKFFLEEKSDIDFNIHQAIPSDIDKWRLLYDKTIEFAETRTLRIKNSKRYKSLISI